MGTFYPLGLSVPNKCLGGHTMNVIIKEKRASGLNAIYAIRNGKKVIIGASWVMRPLLKR
jgi:hypothetical protein